MSIASRIQNFRNPAQTVFTTAEIKQLSEITKDESLYNAINYAIQKKHLYRITKGIYSLDDNYSKQELANKLRTPSYISLYSVLSEEGIVFQPYTSIFLISKRSENVNLDGQEYVYRKIKDEILLNTKGIRNIQGVQKATPERAICDKLYLDGDEFFDNLRAIDWELMRSLNKTVYASNNIIQNFIANNS